MKKNITAFITAIIIMSQCGLVFASAQNKNLLQQIEASTNDTNNYEKTDVLPGYLGTPTFSIPMQDINSFDDISGHWAEESIKFVLSKGLYKGLEGNKFLPDSKMSRGMIVTALAILNGENSKYACNFSDVPANSLYAPYIGWAAKQGIVEGIGNNKFAPNSYVTREQLAVIFVNYAKYIDFNFPINIEDTKFKDDAEISNWASSAVYKIKSAGVVTGKGGNIFDPKGTATRAEVAVMIERMFNLIQEKNIPGGYEEERNLTNEDKKIFDQAMQGLLGVEYVPLKVSTQVVAGMNYKFYAKAKVVSPDTKEYYVYVYIFKPLGGDKATLTKIENIQEKNIPGGYEEERNLTNEDKKIFDQAMQGLLGVEYVPLKVSTQVVAGMNYKFYAKAKVVAPDAKEYYVYVYIFKPLGGDKATLTKIENIQENNITGGYEEERNLTNEDKKIFDQAMQGLLGVEYVPLKVSTQVVAGMNYKFYAKAKVVAPDAKEYYVYVYIFKPLGGDKATLTKIENIQNK